MEYSEVLDHFGNGVKVARALDIDPSAVYQWGRKGIVPMSTQYRIEVVSGGALIADRNNNASPPKAAK